MVSSTMTAGDAADQLRPLMPDDLLRAFHRLGMAVGYRNLARAIAALAPKGKAVANLAGVTTAKPAAHVLTEADTEYITSLESQLVEAETFFQDYPLLQAIPLRINWRWRDDARAFHPRKIRQEIEQLSISADMAQQLRLQGKHVDYDKRSNTHWLDSELIDEAYGKDGKLSGIFGARTDEPGYSYDDLLGKYRQARDFKAVIPGLRAEIARAQVEGA